MASMHKTMTIALTLAALSVSHLVSAETKHERSVRIGKIDKEVFAREHEIQIERNAGKITKEQAISRRMRS